MSVILSQNACSSCGSSSVTIDTILPAQICDLIAPSVTMAIDQVLTTSFRGVKWLVTIATKDASRVRSFEVYATHQNGASPSHIEYSHLGDAISYTLDAAINSGNLQLQVTNNELVDIIIMVTSIPVPITTSAIIVPVLGVVPIDDIHAYVAASSSAVVDSVTAQFRSVKWLVSITDYTNTLNKVIEVYASQRDGVVSANNAYAMSGDYLDVVPSVSLLGEFMQLNIQNNVDIPIMVDITRIPVTACYDTNCECTDVVLPIQNITILSGNTQTIDSVTQLGHRAVKWLVAVTDLTTHQTEMFQLFGVHNDDTATNYTMYGMLGPVLSFTVAVTLSSLNFSLRITNTGANTIQVDAVRLPIRL